MIYSFLTHTQVYTASTEVSYKTTDPSETLSNGALSDPNAAFR